VCLYVMGAVRVVESGDGAVGFVGHADDALFGIAVGFALGYPVPSCALFLLWVGRIGGVMVSRLIDLLGTSVVTEVGVRVSACISAFVRRGVFGC